MQIIFGLALDQEPQLGWGREEGGVYYMGPSGLLSLLERYAGLAFPGIRNDYIRIAQYRLAIQSYLERHPDCFFARSFAADELAATIRLLEMRDELVLMSWDLKPAPGAPSRLAALAGLEGLLQQEEGAKGFALDLGFADRFRVLLRQLDHRQVPVSEVVLVEPRDLLPAHWEELFAKLEKAGTTVKERQEVSIENSSDLGRLQAFLADPAGRPEALSGDGSLLILQSKRESAAAAFLAKMLKANPGFRPHCLVPEKNRALDDAIIQEGLPAMGVLSASPARPSLQLLKLVAIFLWHPLDPYKVMEFLSLPVKPLHDTIAAELAAHLAQRPGIENEGWKFALRKAMATLKGEGLRDKELSSARKQYRFWFERKRYYIREEVPASEVISIFRYLSEWAADYYKDDGEEQSSFYVLAEQSDRIVEMLEAVPGDDYRLTFLQLERLIRTVYESTPLEIIPCETGHLGLSYHPGGLVDEVEELVWWNCVRHEMPFFFDLWSAEEQQYLQQLGLTPDAVAGKVKRYNWQSRLPVLQSRQRLVLVMPAMVNGRPAFPHPLWDVVTSVFDNYRQLVFDIDSSESLAALQTFFALPDREPVVFSGTGEPEPYIQVDPGGSLHQVEGETVTQLPWLLYYPYQWVFRNKIGLRPSPILSLVKESTLMGNLAHRFFELLLREEVSIMDREDIFKWLEDRFIPLLMQEGSPLLLYGKEPEQVAFLRKLQHAAWTLVSMIQDNGWTVLGTEVSAEGSFCDIGIRGKADLVLEKNGERSVVDLKWRGSRFREELIRNEEDLQLVTYSRLFAGEAAEWAHTAYFILEDARMIARNLQAFRHCQAVAPGADHREINRRIWEKMEATFAWRKKQLERGFIEIRTDSTIGALEALYEDQLLPLLEMRDKDAPFDDYKTLIHGIR